MDRGAASGVSDVFIRLHLEIHHERLARHRAQHPLEIVCKHGMIEADIPLVRGFKIERHKKLPFVGRIDPFTAPNVQHLGNFQELYPRSAHHFFKLFHPRFGMEFVQPYVMQHERVTTGLILPVQCALAQRIHITNEQDSNKSQHAPKDQG